MAILQSRVQRSLLDSCRTEEERKTKIFGDSLEPAGNGVLMIISISISAHWLPSRTTRTIFYDWIFFHDELCKKNLNENYGMKTSRCRFIPNLFISWKTRVGEVSMFVLSFSNKFGGARRDFKTYSHDIESLLKMDLLKILNDLLLNCPL